MNKGTKSEFSVATIFPFWRYAVCPEANHSAGIPFYSFQKAVEFFVDTKQQIPWDGIYLIKRGFLSKNIEVVFYEPSNLDFL